MADDGSITELGTWIATPALLDPVMELAMAGCEENGFMKADRMRLLEGIYGAISGQTGVIGVVGTQEGIAQGIVEGAVLLVVGPMWYASKDDLIIEERAIFVHPAYRSGKIGRARLLCEFSKRMADGLGLPLTIGVLSNERTAAKVRLYQRIFGEPAGAFFLYNARTGEA